MKTAVIIVAAGRGMRASAGDVPKQYRMLDGETVLATTISRFAENDHIDALLPVIHSDDLQLYKAATAEIDSKLLEPVFGGHTRQASVYAGLLALQKFNPDKVLIHDAARPFVSAQTIDRVILALGEHDGAIPALPVTDTLKKAHEGRINSTVERTDLWRAQTPQGFVYEKILASHQASVDAEKYDFTDDASLAEWHDLDVVIVEGDAANIKLTTEQDFEMAEHLHQGTSGIDMGEIRIGQGFDVHAFEPGDHVVLCGVKIAHTMALCGHSDADVALHALTDALLGAISDGDIGTHFPPSDPQWRNASSDKFLEDAARRISKRNGTLVNVDVTIVCEEPKIGPHRDAMRERIAQILKMDLGRVSVKATTSEGLGFTGRGEGIAAQASALVKLG